MSKAVPKLTDNTAKTNLCALNTTAQLHTPDVKSIKAGEIYNQVNAEDNLNWHIYFTGLRPTHYRTEAHPGWKAVLSFALSGTILALEDGESDGDRIPQLEAQDMTGSMVQNATKWCDARNDATKGDCV